MDPDSSAQDLHRCDLCETALVHSYCDFCNVNLCKPCVVDHISNGYDKHKIVPFKQRKSTLIYPKCEVHTHKKCDLQCNDCTTFVCTFCLGSKHHKGHDISVLDDVYKIKKEYIKRDAEELQNIISPTYEEIAHDLENQIANLDEGYKNLTAEISKHGNDWHKEIDVVINKMKSEIEDIKRNHKDILEKHLDEIKQIQSLIRKTVQTIKEMEESKELSMAIEYSSKNGEFSKLPPNAMVSLPTFISKPIDHHKLYSLFGQINPLSTIMKQHVLLPKKTPNTSDRKLLHEPEIVAKIHTFHYKLRNIAYIDDEKIWTSGETGHIKCFNIKGLLLQTIKTKSGEWPSDIAINTDGDLLYSDWSKGTVNMINNGQIEELIRLQGWVPGEICVTIFGELLVTMNSTDRTQSKIIRYSGSTEKQTIQFDDEGKPLYSGNDNIKYITENRNLDICVADSRASAVVVVNQTGTFRYKYIGHPSINKMTLFVPHGIATDSQSRILISDSFNHRIDILDQNGQFLRYIGNCDLEYPWGLCVDNNDSLIVCEYNRGNIKKIKYSN